MLLKPFQWSLLTLLISEVLVVLVAMRQLLFIEDENIALPEVSAGMPLAYFFVAVIVIGVALVFLPLPVLKFITKTLFLVLYAWGVFVVLALPLPVAAAVIIAVAGALAWLRWPRLWLHNLLLGVALVGYASVFGFLLSSGVALWLMAVISVYDLVSVRSGHMMWMVNKMTGMDIVPAFIFPVEPSGWRLSVTDIRLDKPDERPVSLLGGGDVGFSLIVLVSVLAAGGLAAAVIMSFCLLGGLVSVYWVQKMLFKGGPTPALPPLTVAALIGYGLLIWFSVI